MTVLDNVLVGGLLRHDVPRARQLAAQCLDRVGLSAIMGKLAADLSFPEQARVELARALCTGPRVFLLDEVMAALNDAEMDALLDLIRTLRGIRHFVHRRRASHAGHHAAVQPDHCCRSARKSPRRARRDCGESDRDRGLPGEIHGNAGGGSMSLLQIQGLTAAYDRSPVLHGVSLEVPEGGFVAVVGANTAARARCCAAFPDCWTGSRAASVSTGGKSCARRPSHPRVRHCPCAGRPARVPRHDSRGKPLSGRLRASA